MELNAEMQVLKLLACLALNLVFFGVGTYLRSSVASARRRSLGLVLQIFTAFALALFLVASALNHLLLHDSPNLP